MQDKHKDEESQPHYLYNTKTKQTKNMKIKLKSASG